MSGISTVLAKFGIGQPPAAPAPANVGLPASAPGGDTAPQVNGGANPNNVIATQANQVVSPLAGFEDLFKNAPTDPNAPTPFSADKIFSGYNRDQIAEAVAKQTFVNPTQEQMAAIAAGGEGAVTAMVGLMNQMAQQVYLRGIDTSVNLTQRGLSAYDNGAASRIPSQVRSQLTENAVAESNPAFSHPAVAPLVDSMRQTIMTKYPTATPAEVTALTNAYLQGFSNVVSGKADQNPADTVKPAEDWKRFFAK